MGQLQLPQTVHHQSRSGLPHKVHVLGNEQDCQFQVGSQVSHQFGTIPLSLSLFLRNFSLKFSLNLQISSKKYFHWPDTDTVFPLIELHGG